MDNSDQAFNANFSADGVQRLKQTVMHKLKDFMGEYTDETLVEYVVVLLKNGRSKQEAKIELDVFLGDDGDPFVSWLWDHLSVHLDLYVQPEELQEDAPKRKISSVVHVGNEVSQHLDSQLERGNSSNRRRDTDRKRVVRGGAEPPPLWSTETENAYLEEKARSKVNRGSRSQSLSPLRKKRGRPDEQPKTKEEVSKATRNASRRLLQFAVRDAVATTSEPYNMATTVEPSLKRLHSMVSTPSGNYSVVKLPQVKQSITRVQNPMATVINAPALAAVGVTKIRSSRNVFDRLGPCVNPLDDVNQLGDGYTSRVQDPSPYLQRFDYVGQYAVNATNSMPLQRNRNQEHAAVTPPNASNKVINTWKPPGYQGSREFAEADGHIIVYGETGATGSGMQPLGGNSKPLKSIYRNGNQAADIQRESQKTQISNPGSSASGRSLDDADSRTIFVSNVHFAATKDSLSRHFNTFGEVLKVIILTEAVTGQPKGSAYVEFMKKEAADNALSLDGTSFMSRILKVVKKSAAHVESVPTTTWSHAMRASPFDVAAFSVAPYPMGTPAFRPWTPTKPGTRSLQWKRDSPGTSDNGNSLNTSSVSAPFARSLKYIRTETKT